MFKARVSLCYAVAVFEMMGDLLILGGSIG